MNPRSLTPLWRTPRSWRRSTAWRNVACESANARWCTQPGSVGVRSGSGTRSSFVKTVISRPSPGSKYRWLSDGLSRLGCSKTKGIPSRPSQKSIDVWRSAPTSVMWWTPCDWSLRIARSTLGHAAGPAQRQQQRRGEEQRARAGKARGVLPVLLLGAQPRAEPLVDVGELTGLVDGVGLRPGDLGDLAQRLGIRRHRDATEAARARDRRALRAQRDGVDRDAQLARPARRLDWVGALGRAPVGEQHDGRRGAAPVAPLDLLQLLDRRGQRVAGRGAALGDQPAKHAPCLVVVLGRLLDGVDHRAVGDDADLEALGHLVDERERRVAGGVQPARLHVGGLHRARDVEHEHHGRLVDRHRDRVLRAREADDQRGERGEEQRSGQVPAPGRRRADDRAHGRDGGEAHDVPAPPAALGDEREHQQRHAQQQQQEERGLEAHRRRPPSVRSQSPSVVRTMCSARAWRRSAATSARPSRSASAKRSRSLDEWVSTSTRSPVSGSISARWPTAGSSSSRGSRISTASVEWRARRAASARRHVRGPRKSETTTTRPGCRASCATRRSVPVSAWGSWWPWGAPPSAAIRRNGASAPRPLRGGRNRWRPEPLVISATRPPRRAARRPSTSTTPSATSALSRSAVPKAIEGETSSTSHVVSARSGTCSRTCGMPVRALAAGSSWRTSSPGTYGRSWKSSVPAPTPGALRSPGSTPAARRAIARLSASTSPAGSAPGPWRPAGETRAGRVTRRRPP